MTLAMARLKWEKRDAGLPGAGHREIPPEKLAVLPACAGREGFKEIDAERAVQEMTRALAELALKGEGLGEALDEMARRMVEIMGAEVCAISLWDQRHETLSPRARCERETGGREEPVCIDLALQGAGGKLGAMQVALRPPHPLDERGWAGWEAIALQASLAIAHLQAIESEKKHRLEAGLLQQATVSIASSLDLEEVLSQILTSLEQAVPFDSASICLIEKDALRIAALGGLAWHARQVGDRIKKTSGLFSLLEGARAPVYLADAQQHDRYENWSQSDEFTLHGWMGVPLIANERAIGYLLLNSRESDVYTPDHARLAQAFASHAAAAIEKARLFEQVRNGRARLERLSKRLLKIQEEERRYIARELHDEIGQELSGLQFALESGLDGTSIRRLEAMRVAQDVAARLLAKVRELSLNLHPAMIEDVGLLPPLRSFFGRFEQKTGLQVRFFQQNLERRFPVEVEVSAFRVVQEALTNAARYAGVQQVEVVVAADESALTVLVTDQGQGFDPHLLEDPNRAFGISGMRERTELAGGTFELVSRPGAGTRISAVFPNRKKKK